MLPLREAIEALVIMISPFAPHTAEELWEMTGHAGGIAKASWPSFDERVAKADEIVVPVQVNGKLRSRLTVPPTRPKASCASARWPIRRSGRTSKGRRSSRSSS